MNGTTKPTMTATQKRTSSQREENGGVIATFINQFPPIDWICQVGKHFLDGSLDLAADFELQHRHRTSLPLVLLTSARAHKAWSAGSRDGASGVRLIAVGFASLQTGSPRPASRRRSFRRCGSLGGLRCLSRSSATKPLPC